MMYDNVKKGLMMLCVTALAMLAVDTLGFVNSCFIYSASFGKFSNVLEAYDTIRKIIEYMTWLVFAGIVFQYIGLYFAGKDVDGYANALKVAVFLIALDLIEKYTKGEIKTAFSIASSALNVYIYYLVIDTTNSVLNGNSEFKLSNFGSLIWKIFVVGIALYLIGSVLGMIKAPANVRIILNLLSELADVVAGLMYFVYLILSCRKV